MYRQYALKFNKKKVEFINCVNMVERIKKARALPSGTSHLGVKRYTIASLCMGNKDHYTIKDCI